MNTDDLIRQLADTNAPVRRLRPPWLRALAWLAIAVPYVALVIALEAHAPPVTPDMFDPRMLVEWTAALATGATAAWAAFTSTVPGYDRRILWIPAVPAALWAASLGTGCAGDWLQFGWDGLALRPDWACLPAGMLAGIVPLIAILAMLRRGAPLRPNVSVALAGLAVAGLGNAGMRFFHHGDITIMIVVWHVGIALALAALVGALGRLVLSWRQARARALPPGYA